MDSRTIYLIAFRNSTSQRAHFSILVPSAADSSKGTLIHVVGAPMAGYSLEFKRNYAPEYTQQAKVTTAIGTIYSENIVDSPPTASGKDSTPRGNIELVANQIPPPRISENFLAPVNDVSLLLHRPMARYLLITDHESAMPGMDYGLRAQTCSGQLS